MSALAIALAVTVLAAGGPAAVDVRLSPAVAHVGDTVTLEIAVRAFGANTIRIEPLPGSVEEDYVEDETLLGSDLLVASRPPRRSGTSWAHSSPAALTASCPSPSAGRPSGPWRSRW